MTSAVSVPYELCGGKHITVKSVDASVWPPHPGDSITLKAVFETDEDITGGTYKAEGSLDGLPLYQKEGKLTDFDVKFPIKKGENTLQKTFKVPEEIPEGDLELKATAYDQNNDELICAKVKIDTSELNERTMLSDERIQQALENIVLPKTVTTQMIVEEEEMKMDTAKL